MSKASNLKRLEEAGVLVPAFVVVPETAFEAFQSSLKHPVDVQSILEAPLPAEVHEAIVEGARALHTGVLAVRSSAAGEDAARHSFAGQLDSFLRVPNSEEAVVSAVRKVWGSAIGPRATTYRRQHGLEADGIRMEVILQIMVEAEVSGILFTADPVQQNTNWIVISMCRGDGEALARGAETGDTVRVHRETFELEGDTTLLGRSQLEELCREALSIEEAFGRPQDIEFCHADGRIFFLQARPITTSIGGQRILWDNSNITESYSGVTSPMTYSIIRGAYKRVYRDFLQMMGAAPVDERVLRDLLGLYNGQVYYQLFNWYEALRALPAFEQNRAFMDQMMGVKQPGPPEAGAKRGGRWALATWAVRMIGLHLTSQRRVDEFLDRFGRIYAERRKRDLSSLNPHQLLAEYDHLETHILGDWRAPILTDFMAMIFFGALRRVCERWLGAEGAVHNDLLAGEGNIESLEPVREVSELARMVRANTVLAKAFQQEADETLRRIETVPELAGFRAALSAYLDRFGDRCINELKLEEPNLRDDPLPLIRWIGAAARRPEHAGRETEVRGAAEKRVERLPLVKRVLVQWLLRNARRYVRNRENMRFARSRLYGMLRGILNSIGRQWAERGILTEARDIYYLTIQEVFDFVHGTAVTQNLAGLADLRRAEYKAHRAGALLPNRFETVGAPYEDSPRELLPPTDGDAHTLRGTGCCSGTVSGTARVIRHLEGTDEIDGRILVAERTDPGWIFLFPSALGILVERGSPLSHSAIVAREMGKPIIVNIPGLTERVRDGDRLEMDGQRGVVRILEP